MNDNKNTIDTVVINKKDLIQTLTKNLENHKKIVQEAQTGYLEKAREELNAKLKQIRNNELVPLTFTTNLPVDYSKSYTDVITQLNWDKREELSLSNEDFKQYVLDDWHWDRIFFKQNATYSSMASGMCMTKSIH